MPTSIPRLIGACALGVGTGCSPLGQFQDPGWSPSSPVSGLFSGMPEPEPPTKPMVVYPLAGSMHPINLADTTFQKRRGPGVARTLFRIRLRRINGDAVTP
jgi:hypothetical protein